MVTTHSIEQNTDAWLEARLGKFTGSNALKLLKYGRCDKAKAQKSTFKGNYWTKRAHELEPFAITAYEMTKEVKVERPGFWTNDKYPNCLYSPDGVEWDASRLNEVKCFAEERHLSINRRNIPAEILAQTHFGKIMGELDEMVLILFNPDLHPKKALKIINIPTDKRLELRLKRMMSNEK